ncbi:hypothetical protein BC828DRAFT_428175 [Blastocladiella britannica]|nr:hypothetical protein BC828DRAFT_428175 [Blastocladiella britannica]
MSTTCLSVPSTILLASRLMGLSLAIPSLITNVHMNSYNALKYTYRATGRQKSLLISVLFAIAIDLINFGCHLGWFVSSGTWDGWGPLTTASNMAKRLNGSIFVYMILLRAVIILPGMKNVMGKHFPILATLGYLALGGFSSIAHLMSYLNANWVSLVAYYDPLYKWFRVTDAICVAMYGSVAILSDVQFLRAAKQSLVMQRKFHYVRMYYNPTEYVILEIVLLIVVWGSLTDLINAIIDDRASVVRSNHQPVVDDDAQQGAVIRINIQNLIAHAVPPAPPAK